MKHVASLVVLAACATPAPPPAPPPVASAPSIPAPTADWYCVQTNARISLCEESLEDCKQAIAENQLRDHDCTHASAGYCVYLDYDTGVVGRQCMRTHDECMDMLQPALDHASDRLAPEDRSCEPEPGR